MKLSGNIVDVVAGEIFPGTLTVRDGVIVDISRDAATYSTYLLPGLVDAHVHIESSMLVPSEFARMAVVHGTVATVSDPHEIGNVLGVAGVEFMIEEGATAPFKFMFGAPSCVPATSFETAGAEIDVDAVRALLARPQIGYLSEMMNYPGVIGGDPMVLAKIRAAHDAGKPVDGHAPAVSGDALRAYVAAGITTDHESFTLDEANEKIALGMKILIREGSAAKNFDALVPLVASHPERCMFCSDDKHPDDLLEGHIDALVRRAVARGIDPLAAVRCATLNPVRHYRLAVGLLQPGDPADLIEVTDLARFEVLRTFVDGRLVAERGVSLIARDSARLAAPVGGSELEVNRFDATPRRPADFRVESDGGTLRIIDAIDEQLVTRSLERQAIIEQGAVACDLENDIVKIAVVNRYQNAAAAVTFIRGFGLRRGAIASSVAHDSHNIIAVGASDDELCRAVNAVIDNRGGLSVVDGAAVETLALPVAGLMSADDGRTVAERYSRLDRRAKELGSSLRAPYMTLSFMALLVIPSLKLSDQGLFDGERFQFVPLLT
jgi:adenine deaminase